MDHMDLLRDLRLYDDQLGGITGEAANVIEGLLENRQWLLGRLYESGGRKYVALFVDGKERWYARGGIRVREDETTPPGCVETIVRATGRYTVREDGEIAEIFE